MFYAGLSSYISSYIHSLPILCDFFEFIKNRVIFIIRKSKFLQKILFLLLLLLLLYLDRYKPLSPLANCASLVMPSNEVKGTFVSN